jgi:hypothetical protein
MNIIQYSKLENIADYLKRWSVEKVIVHPDIEEEVKNSKLADVIDEKNIISLSPEKECEKRKLAAGKTKASFGKKQAEDLTPAAVIVEKLKEVQEHGDVNYQKVARLGSKMTDFAKLDEYTPQIHKLQWTPPKRPS